MANTHNADSILNAQIANLERRMRDAQMRADRLARLQTLFAESSLDDGRDALCHIGVTEIAQTLGFGRVIMFETDGHGLVPVAIFDDADPSPNLQEYHDLPYPNIMNDVLTEGKTCIDGDGNDLTAPVYDVRTWYACAPVIRGGTHAVIYADDPAEGTQGPWTVETLERAGALLGLLIEGARMLEHQRLQAERAEQLAMHDPLTGLLNRRAFNERVHDEIARQSRANGSFCFVEIDVDDFKKVNDTYGHDVGDQYLVRLARTLEESVRDEDVVARLGGDEFALLLPNADETAGKMVLSRVYDALKRNRLPCSIGAAIFPHSGQTESEITKNADAALYEAKRRGKNTYCFHQLAAA
jgi:diguanylate cyclase (GGDEF)-like protein